MSTPSHRHPTLNRRVPLPAIAGIVVGVLLGTVVPAQLASASASTIASDSFTRTSKSGWGTAVKGGKWSVSVRSGASTTVSSGRAAFRNVARGTSAVATLGQVSSGDTAMRATVGLPSRSATLYTAFQFRKQSSGTVYRGRLELSTKHRVVLSVSRVNNGKPEVQLGSFALPGTYAPSARINAEYQVVGTSPVTISGRAWTPGSAQPDWQLEVVDSSASRIKSPGAVGIWQYSGKANAADVTSTFDNLTVTKNPDPATDPAEPTTPTPTATPAPTTSPIEAPAQEPARAPRGSAALGSTEYAVPSGAIVVSPAGSDSNAGTLAAPMKTVAAAIKQAVSGDTIVLRAGTYNEAVLIPKPKTLTVQSYPGEVVWFDGSAPVSSWSRSGDAWSTPWGFFPTSVVDGVADNPRFVDPAKPYASRPDQVFFDGAQLTQVGSAAAVTAGTFYPDPSSGRILLGSDPTGHAVRISNQPQAIQVQSPNSILQGFGVRRYGTNYLQRGAVRLQATGSVARNLVIEDNAMIGLVAENDAPRLSRLTIERNGLMGVGANESYGFQLTDSIIDGNNSQAFKTAPVAGGVKITRSRGVLFENNQVRHNIGTGIWLDESVYDSQLVGNDASGNTIDGILLELSDHAIVANNVLNDNRSGIVIYNTANVQVYNNDIGGNRQFGVKLAQDERRQANTAITGHDRRRPLPDPTLTWIVKNVTVSNNAFGSGGLFQIYALDNVTNIPVDDMDLTVTGNLFNQRLTTAQATLVGWGGGDNRTVTRYDTVQALASAKGSTWKNDETTAVLPITSMASAAAGAASIAAPLPADIASLIGQKAGTRHVGAF